MLRTTFATARRFGYRFQSSIPQVTSLAELQKIAANEKLTLVDFYATWCGPCKAISPILEKWAAEEYADKVQFVKVDVDETPDVAHEYGVSAMPTFVFFKNSEALGKMVGANPQGIKKGIDQLM